MFDSYFFEGENNILISIPHGVKQTRLGHEKVAEIGTIPFGVIVANNTNSNLIIKTKNNFDDANFDLNCAYKKRISEIIKNKNIKYLIDIHGLAKWRDIDINFGTNLENNIKPNIKIFNDLTNLFNTSFKTTIDQPFMATNHTIAGYFSKKYGIWTLQIEINCALTNYIENIEKFNLLVNLLCQWIRSIETKNE